MATTAGTVTIPIYAKLGGKEFHIGDIEIPIRAVPAPPGSETAIAIEVVPCEERR